jgi:long-chain acyl-CoA synthetase
MGITAESALTATGIAPVFFAQAKLYPDKQAICFGEQSISYQELAELVNRWSHALQERGVKHGEHIGVLLPNCIEFVAMILVAADLGVVLVPLSTALTADAIQRAFKAADVKHVVATSAMFTSLLANKNVLQAISGLYLSIDAPLAGITYLGDLLQAVPQDVQPIGAGKAEDALILTMTSGSTGDPKPIILTQRTKFNRASAAITLYGVTAQDRTLTATPLYHSLAERLVLIPLLSGGTAILMQQFSATEWLKCVKNQQVTFTIAVSSQLKQIAEHLHVEDAAQIASLRCVVSSSALLDHQVKADLRAKFNCDFHECYGASEIAIASNLDSVAAKNKLQSVGQAAIGVEIRIIDEQGKALPAGEVGEIVCKTPMLFGGYYQRPDLTATAMWGDYFRTGDVGKLDEEGFLYFLGRKKDIIISGGINVYPADIESVLADYPAVFESAAFAYPDQRLGEIVAIAIVPTNKAEFDLRKLRFYCCEKLADFQQPRKFFVVDALPRNGMGKLMKFQLVKTFAHT